ncbi:hypothetical protein [Marinospirillum alkaliphilum]|uniref:ABC-type Zn uptake system ZnuABC, Zn-binding component ZnuA n=1 Tax=Marinospirillum alkaliphilum DSM 21637 TaxID=1122209 RepID=A0A1K1UWS9_9GAMM|nr:hypothetical protein [Marinospirillum alkaliphilum]SFX17248.1 hypothetical protein SAMN02745752_00645 [Marinospirillum alkaliphilum DSM 21637]
MKKTLLCFKHLFTAVIPALACLLLSTSLQAASLGSAAPVTQLLARDLTQGTGIQLHYLPAERLPLNRIPAWFNRVNPSELPALDAVLTLESVWQDINLYPALRQRNIRVVPIDLAQEIAPGGARVIQRPGLLTPDYFWLDLNNLTLMVNIAARDLSRIWPEQATTLDHNRRQLVQQIQQTAIQLDDLLLEAGIESLAVDDERLVPLALMMAVPLVTADQADMLLSTGKRDGQRTWVVDPLLRTGQESLADWLQQLLSSLQVAAE